MRKRGFVAVGWFCLAALALGQPAPVSPGSAAAEGHPTLRGRVLDSTRAAIAGARITAIPSGRSTGPATLSDQSGEFSLALEPGDYTLHLAAEGFQEAFRPVSLADAAPPFQEVILQIAPLHGTIIVTETANYQTAVVRSATKTLTPLRDVPQSITVVPQELIRDQSMQSIGDVLRYVPGITAHQGENNRDQVVIRGNSSSADFFVNGVRDDVQYYRDLYNLERLEVLKGPNAMMFGRGGAGGVVNRITKKPGPAPLREITLQGGSYSNKRFATDFDHSLADGMAFRVNGLYENSDSFRQHVNLRRYGVSPTLTIDPSDRTKITLGYEHFRDNRVADRGIPSFQARPVDAAVSTYFGNPDDSHVRATVNLGSATLEHQAGGVSIRNHTQFGGYDRGYQNYVPGNVTADKTQVAISAYNNATQRLNAFNQTDFTYMLSTGPVGHTFLAGIEVGRQVTDNFRNTGFFNNSTTTVFVPYANPAVQTPVTFRQSATDADNHLRTNLAATYLQDQVELSRYLQVIAGLRFDYFDLQYHNNRTGDDLRRIDHLVSPRAGIVFKPVSPLSIYGSYSVSYLPSSGDQFSSLTTITQQVKPEKFSNYEAGIKWDVNASLSLTTAVYQLNRTNTRSTDPNDPARIVQTGSQRTDGFEIGVNGKIFGPWTVAGGYAYQDAFVTNATASAGAGAQVAQAPHHSFSLWNHYQAFRRSGVGLGIISRSDMYAAIDNTVILPGYIRFDAAVFHSLTETVRLQFNVENLLNKKYYVNANNNANISPGSSRAIRLGLMTRF